MHLNNLGVAILLGVRSRVWNTDKKEQVMHQSDGAQNMT